MADLTREAVDALRCRARELDCLYRIEKLLADPDAALERVLDNVVRAIPIAWEHPDTCQARIALGDVEFQSPGFRKSVCAHQADLAIADGPQGTIEIWHGSQTPPPDEDVLGPEKRRFIDVIAGCVGQFVALHGRLNPVELEALKPPANADAAAGPDPEVPAAEPAPDTGLCATCDNRHTCTFPRPPGGVWHCEEFA